MPGPYRRAIAQLNDRFHPLPLLGDLPSKHWLQQRYRVTRSDSCELVRQTFYDSAVYPAAGTLNLQFFNLPLGQGVGFGGGTKSYSDTNLQTASQLPKHNDFVLEGVEIHFQPTTPTVAAQMPASYGTPAIAQIVNDTYIFRRSGNLNLTIGNKPYLQEAPMMRFPAKTGFRILTPALSDATTAAAAQQSRIAFADAVGPIYALHPAEIFIESTQAFILTLAWPEGAQAITNPARIFVVFHGMLIRATQ
jgi:hypothetical protein